MVYYANKKQALAAVSESGAVLFEVSEELQADKDVVMAAVNQNGWILNMVNKELQADKDVVMVAVANNPNALLFTKILTGTLSAYARDICSVYSNEKQAFLQLCMHAKMTLNTYSPLQQMFSCAYTAQEIKKHIAAFLGIQPIPLKITRAQKVCLYDRTGMLSFFRSPSDPGITTYDGVSSALLLEDGAAENDGNQPNQTGSNTL